MWTVFACVFFLSAVAVRFALFEALKKSLLDIPNERSSHKLPVPRLGGAAFIPVILLVVGLLSLRADLPAIGAGFTAGDRLPLSVCLAFLGGAIALYAVSLADDFLTLSTTVRFAVQFAAAGILLWAVVAAVPAGTFDFLTALLSPASSEYYTSSTSASSLSRVLPSLSLFLLTFWIAGLINIYNFMDGIDGIAGVQAVVAGIAWCIFGTILAVPFVAFFGACVAAGALGFLTLNWPPAKIFMGDAGSTVLGYIFAVVPLVAVVESRLAVRSASAVSLEVMLIAAALVLWPFLIDGTFTILRRLKNRENILTAHRSHLYQRLVIAGKSHLQITLVYGGLALVGAGLAWRVITGASYAVATAVGVVTMAFAGLWTWTVVVEKAMGGDDC